MTDMSSDKLPILSEASKEEENAPSSSNIQSLGSPHLQDGDADFSIPKQDSVESSDLPVLMVYTRRWYILLLFGLLACHQCIVWNTFGPIESGVQFAYNWENSTAPMLANWGTIMFCLSVVPLSKLVEV